MSTDPTIFDSAAATEAALDIDSIKEMMDAFDPATLLPELGDVFILITGICQIAMMIAPVILLVMGVAYLLFAPKEANYYFGYRCYYGMGSVEAWRFTQRLAGAVLGVLGLILTGVMLVIVMGFPNLGMMDMVWKAFWCLIWQGILVLLANIAIWAVTFFRFDARGNIRVKNTRK